MHFSNLFTVSQILASGLVAAGPIMIRQTTASAVQCAGTFAYTGCAAEPFFNGGSGRGLIGNSTQDNGMTVEECASFCSGYTYFGVEYATQCFCGNALQTGTVLESDGTNCNAVCGGNPAEFCGGSGHMNLYTAGLAQSGSGTSGSSCGASTTAVSSASSTSTSSSSTTIVATTPASTTTTSLSTSSSSTTTVALSTTSTSSSVISTTTVSPSTISTASTVASTTSTAKSTITTTTTSSSSSSSSQSSSKTSSTTSSIASATPSSSFFSLASCPSFSATLSAWNLPFVFTPYYNGVGYTENMANPGNLIPSLLPAKTYNIAGNYNACQAVQQCLSDMDTLNFAYLSFDLHYLTTTNSWQCVAYAGNNVLPSFFNVPNAAVSHAYGFNGLLKFF